MSVTIPTCHLVFRNGDTCGRRMHAINYIDHNGRARVCLVCPHCDGPIQTQAQAE